MKKFLKIALVLTLFAVVALPVTALDSYKESFDSYDVGDTFDFMDELPMYFETSCGTADSLLEVDTDGEENYFRISGFTDLRSYDYYYEYVFSVDVATESYGNNAVFIRGEFPGALVILNPKNAGSMQTFNYYEWDWYAENGGAGGGSNIGGSGIAVVPREGEFQVMIKKYAEDGLTVTSDYYNFEMPEDSDFTDFTNLKFTDDGKEIFIYCDGTLMCRIALSTESVTYDSDGTDVAYFKSATVFYPDGSEAGTTENTRIHYEGGQIAITSRVCPILIDNISVIYGDGAVEADKNGTTDDTTAAATQAPATEAPATDAATEGETGASDTGETAPVTKAPDDKQSGGISTKTWIIIAAAAFVVILVVVVAIVVKPKKKA